MGGGDAPALRILLVEDHDALREMLAGVLRDAGYAVEAVDSPADARRLLHGADGRYGLIIADHHLPGESGASLVHAIHATHPTQRFLYISGDPRATALPGPDLAHDALVPADVPRLTKPFHVHEFTDAVHRALHLGLVLVPDLLQAVLR
jgi:DNA-binding NtrC family response regulator